MSAVIDDEFSATVAAGAPIEDAPEWFNTLRAEGFAKFNELEWPTRKNENWRFGAPKKSIVDQLEEPEFEDAFIELHEESDDVIRFTFLNGMCISVDGEVPEGVIAMPLTRAIHEEGDRVQSLIPELQGKLGSDKLAAFHRANLDDGAVIYVQDGVKLEKPIEIINSTIGSGRSQNYLLLVAGENSKVSVIERFLSDNTEDESTIVAVADVRAQKGAELNYLSIQQLNEKSKLIRLGESVIEEQAIAKTSVLHIGGEWVRDEFYSTVAGRDAKSHILSVALPKNEQIIDQRTFQHHASPNCYSNLLYKNTLYGKSKTIFSGLIFVDEGAHHTDAYQTCRNLLMTDTSEANSMPGLEINADQVACSHGSTSAQVSEEEIYYLQARGIPADQARHMIAEGFCADVFKKLGDDPLEEAALEALRDGFQDAI